MSNARTLASTINSSSQIVVPSGGVNFGTSTDGTGTFTGGVLDDYEEGTWTPTMTGATSGGGTITANLILCTYTKIGRLVNISIGLNGFTFPDATTFVGELRLGGIPFTPINGNYESNVGDVYFYPSGQWDAFSNFTGLSATINSQNGAFINFKPKVTDSDRQITLNNGNTNFSSSSDKYLRFSMTYITD